MNWILEAFRNLVARWIDGFAMTTVDCLPHQPVDDEIDREVWKREREHLANSPWWM